MSPYLNDEAPGRLDCIIDRERKDGLEEREESTVIASCLPRNSSIDINCDT